MTNGVEDEASRGSAPPRRRARLAGGRERRFYVKASVEEEARLVELAARRGVSVPRLLVESTLAPGGPAGAACAVAAPAAHPAVVTELTAMTRALARVGVNVNQIARATNATRETQPGTAVAVEAVAHVAARLDALLDELGRGRSVG